MMTAASAPAGMQGRVRGAVRAFLAHDAIRILILAALYGITGKLGLFLAVPPGFATIIWPPSGIALGMLIMHGRRLWPGILLGSFLLNAQIAGAFSASDGLVVAKLPLAFGIAAGSTVQALAGWFLVRRFIGLPLKFNRFRDIGRLLLLCGPLACVVAASVGVSCLYLAGVMPADKLSSNWLAWWAGDLFGIVVFLPLVLMAPGGSTPIEWRGAVLGRAPVLAVLLVLIPLGLTFYGWKIASQSAYDHSREQFQGLTSESEKALLHRLGSYDSALIGASAYWQETPHMTHSNWRRYVQALGLEQNYPGIKGIGWVQPVADNQLQRHAAAVRSDGIPSYQIHPITDHGPHYIITYLEPQNGNAMAMGLDLGFEAHRREAAERARDTGRPAMSRRVILVQDQAKRPGFLLYHPLYRDDMPTDTVDARRPAFAGWIYSPFIADNLLSDLTASQGATLNLRVYDEGRESPDTLIYSSGAASNPAFTLRRTLSVGQSQWLLVWDSTPQFDTAGRYYNPAFILIGGLLFTGMFGVFVFVSSLRNGETLQLLAGRQRFVLPALVLAVMSAGAVYLYRTLDDHEVKFVHALVDKDGARVQQLIASQAQAELAALDRMSGRWRLSGGTPQALWRFDATAHVKQMPGLEALQWLDRDLKVQWTESAAIVDAPSSADHRQQLTRLDAVSGSDKIILAPPMRLGTRPVFVAYAPLQRNGLGDGYVAGTFSVDGFLRAGLPADLRDAYTVELDNGKDSFVVANPPGPGATSWRIAKPLVIANQSWTLKLTPTEAYIQRQTSVLPILALIAGLIISALTALSVQTLVVLRLRSRDLESLNRHLTEQAVLKRVQEEALSTSEETFRSAMENASIGMALVDTSGRWLRVNTAICDLLGYSAQDLLSNDFQSITLPEDLDQDMDLVRRALAGDIANYVLEKRYFRKDGSIIWTLLTVSLVRDSDGQPRYFITQIQDITERKEMERLKSEFISVVSHELRTPLTSIRGSLGLLASTMAETLPDKAVRLIELARKNCERLIPLINDILDLDKIGSGKMRFDIREEGLADLIARCVEANQPFAQRYGVTLAMAPVDSGLTAQLDAARFEQALTNLLSNAAKFSSSGQTVEVTVTADQGVARIHVRDHGQGIPEEFRQRIFGRFSQADSSSTRARAGTGLGLHITRQIVEHMGGHIGFDSDVGVGTTFWLDFPLAVTQPADLSGVQLLTESAGRELPSILHIEDDADFSHFLTAALQGRARVTTAATLHQGRSLISAERFDLIILDRSLPDGDGLSALGEGAPPAIILSDMEASEPEQGDIRAALVKSRHSEAKIIATILAQLPVYID